MNASRFIIAALLVPLTFAMGACGGGAGGSTATDAPTAGSTVAVHTGATKPSSTPTATPASSPTPTPTGPGTTGAAQPTSTGAGGAVGGDCLGALQSLAQAGAAADPSGTAGGKPENIRQGSAADLVPAGLADLFAPYCVGQWDLTIQGQMGHVVSAVTKGSPDFAAIDALLGKAGYQNLLAMGGAVDCATDMCAWMATSQTASGEPTMISIRPASATDDGNGGTIPPVTDQFPDATFSLGILLAP
jgi:hypothetical protein